MSEWKGKQSWSRIKNYKNFYSNFDNIDFSNYKKVEDHEDKVGETYDGKKCLFLDDMRFPEDAYLYDEKMTLLQGSGIPYNKWDVVRSYDEFVNYISNNGIPDVVSFDNDLDPFQETKEERDMCVLGLYDFERLPNKTGCHCAQYLANECVSKKHNIPEYYIHTMNSLARPIIKRIMAKAQRIIENDKQ